MKNNTTFTEAGKQYAEAHAVHYITKNLLDALKLYMNVMDKFPDTMEAEYSRTQIQNIVQNVVPKKKLMDAHVELVMTCLNSR